MRVDCKSAKEILQKDNKNLVSKQIFARWQAILWVFDFEIQYIKGEKNYLPDFLTREYLQGRSTDNQQQHDIQDEWPENEKADDNIGL